MRRIVIMIAVYTACCSAWVAAAPPERMSGRLQQYDEPIEQLRANRGRPAQASYQDARRGGYQQNRRASYNSGRPAAYYEGPQQQPSSRLTQQTQQTPPPMDYQDAPPSGPQGPVAEEWQPGFDDGYYGGGDCGDCGDCCCNTLFPQPGFWGRAEYLYWWVRGMHVPPLVTTSPQGTPQIDAGVLPEATILFGDQRLNQSGRSGGRFTLGYWFNGCCQPTGIESSFFFLGQVEEQYYNSSQGNPILARPFFNAETPGQDSNLIAYPDIVRGEIGIQATSRVYGGDVNFRRVLFVDCNRRYDLIVGYRYFQLLEGLNINTNTVSEDTQSPVTVGTTFDITDSFTTRNNFNGGQVGINAKYNHGYWTLDLLAKLAIGNMSQQVDINGTTIKTSPGAASTIEKGGILALDTNIGTYNRNDFSVLPELGVGLEYQLTPLWRLNFGYTLLLVSNIVRPGDQIDMNVSPNQFPPRINGAYPQFAFNISELWLQGINFGIECNF